MNTTGSVYPSFVADKCVEFLCARNCSMQPQAAPMTAARFLMMHGYVETRTDRGTNGTSFAVLSPDTPRFYYAVDLRSETCTCADFLRTQRPCKHICAVVLTLLAQRRLELLPRTQQRKAWAK